MAMALAKLIDLSFESINVCVKAIIMLTTTLIDLVVSVSKVIFLVLCVCSGLGCNSLSLAFLVKCMALLTFLLAVPVEAFVGEAI